METKMDTLSLLIYMFIGRCEQWRSARWWSFNYMHPAKAKGNMKGAKIKTTR